MCFNELDIYNEIKGLKANDQKVIIYEPTLDKKEFNGCKVINDIDEFKEKSSVIMANRLDNNLLNVSGKVYTRDLYSRD